MKRIGYILLIGLLVFVHGCGFLDMVAGVNPQTGQRVAPPGQAPLEVIGKLASPFIPGLDVILAGAAGIWAALRGRRWKKIATTGIETVSEIRRQSDEDGKINVKDLLRLWAAKQDSEGVRWYARGLAHKVEARQ